MKKYVLKGLIVALVIIAALSVYLLSKRPPVSAITYGVTFSAPYARELGLHWKEVYRAMLDDMGVRHLRLAAYWPVIEPSKDKFNFEELDFQIAEAEKRGADVVLAVGRRLPRWPECHVPGWAAALPWDEQKKEIRELITATVVRYKDRESITLWQVENEPYLLVYGDEQCGALDEEFLIEEIALVKELDPSRQILVTDSGNLGLWYQAYRAGDAFGTSLYMYFWNQRVGPFKSKLPPAFYRIKYNLVRFIYGDKPAYIIELSAEPWLVEPIVETPLETQFERMDVEKFKEIISRASQTGFDRQYLWGVEWWYWLKENGTPSFWEYAEELFEER